MLQENTNVFYMKYLNAKIDAFRSIFFSFLVIEDHGF